jgi:dihydrofolate synthase/folylpolyglutamate synthase
LLEEFLNAKPLYYDEIDYTRMPRVYESIKAKLKLPKIIHVIGTNGKGTTGRFLAAALYANGYNVGHYTSPHILEFNERIWLNGENISNEALNAAHIKLLTLLTDEDAKALSYFEYTTLLAMVLYQECDYVVLEAGLGGEHDATSVFDNILTVVTPIDFDHEAFLGTNIEEIATTKLNAVKKEILLGKQHHEEVFSVAKKITSENKCNLQRYDMLLSEDDNAKIEYIASKNSLASYLIENLKLATAALKRVQVNYETDYFDNAKLFGRLSKLTENILLDVGHNTLAARSIAQSLQGQKYILVYNSYKDKNYKEILHVLTPIIERVEIIEVDEERIEKRSILEDVIAGMGFEYTKFDTIDDDKKYLVFGSFSVAETFLKKYRDG